MVLPRSVIAMIAAAAQAICVLSRDSQDEWNGRERGERGGTSLVAPMVGLPDSELLLPVRKSGLLPGEVFRAAKC